jgi:hypothetical protein
MRSNYYHRRLDLCAWGNKRMRRLDIRHTANLPRVKPELESLNQDLSSSNPGAWWSVMYPFPIKLLVTDRL